MEIYTHTLIFSTLARSQRGSCWASMLLSTLFLLSGVAPFSLAQRTHWTAPARQVYAASSAHQTARSPEQHLPTLIHWQEVLHTYTVLVLVAAPGDPATLYACALPSSTEFNFNSLFLRSTDAGAHWQKLTATPDGDLDCSVIVNPTQANDLYVASTSRAAASSSALEHSSDGGQTWTSIQATLTTSDGQRVPWNGNVLSFVGNRLFALQQVQNNHHLISSGDGGRSWTVVDASLTGSDQEVNSYAVDPTMPGIIYELVGTGSTLVSQLYKTTDGGQHWRKLLSSVPGNSRIQLASANQNLIYVGTLTHPAGASSQSGLDMQRSLDGGSTWQQVASPANTELLNNWFVGASGLLYGTSYTLQSGGQALNSSIQCYNPSTGQWSIQTTPSITGLGTLLALTPASSTNGTVLWFIDLENTDALYYGSV